MSRSYKKHPIATIRRSSYKKIYNRKIRRCKDPAAIRLYKKFNNSWEIRDYVSFYTGNPHKMTNEEAKMYKRK